MVVEDIASIFKKVGKLESLLVKIGEIPEAEHLATEIRECAEALNSLNHVLKEDNVWTSVLEKAPGFIIVTDTNGIIQYINQVRTGMKKEDALGQSVYNFIPEAYHQTVKNNFKSVLATGNPTSFETMGEGDHKETVWYRTHLGALYTDGKITGHILVANEIKKDK